METKKINYFLGAAALALALTACGNDQQAATPAPASSDKMIESPAHTGAANVIKGKVAEAMDSGGYTYLRIDDGSAAGVWAAIPPTQVAVGDQVTLQDGTAMENFPSNTLNRTFETIIFSSGLVMAGGDQVVSDTAGGGSFSEALQSEEWGGVQQAVDSGGSAGSIVPAVGLKIDKAVGDNARTVGELFAQASALDAQKVKVKGQVVKFSPNIMGRNWLHIQDGTGSSSNNSHDLVVTTHASTEEGTVVTVEGVLAANKDFGSGYRYDVIIEEATVTQ